jgi:putative toxin-antitoxin system antitoxin component (TIGR02293 family)
MPEVEQVVDVLGGRAVLRRAVRTWDDLDHAVQDGLPKRSLQHVARRVVEPGASVGAFVYSVVPPATYKRRTRLSVDESERTERLARVVAAAEAVWGDRREARAFLNRPHPLLSGRTPVEVGRSELGARRVERLLHDVEHGLPL